MVEARHDMAGRLEAIQKSGNKVLKGNVILIERSLRQNVCSLSV